jgi:hypothetical protein
MKQELTAEPFCAGEDSVPAPPQPHASRQEAPPVAAPVGEETGRDLHPPEQQAAAAIPDDPNIDAALPSMAAAMTGDRSKFLHILGNALAAELSPAMRGKLLRAGESRWDEMTTLSRLVGNAIVQMEPATAAVIAAALAARTVGRSLLQAGIRLGTADREALLAAWFDAARAIVAVRGPDGLRRLLPAAAHVARRPPGIGKSGAEIAAATRRVAARIAEEPPRIGACDVPRESAGTSECEDPFRARRVAPSSAQRPAELTIPSR